jgi:hypothetical protein
VVKRARHKKKDWKDILPQLVKQAEA